jgi:hypothetical protein
MIFMGKEILVVVSEFTKIADFSHMAVVVVDLVIRYDLVDAFFSQFVGFPGLNLENRPFLLCCDYFWVLGVDVNLFEELFDKLFWDVFGVSGPGQEHQELEDAENIIFLREGDVGVEITRKDEFIAFGHKAVELPDFCLWAEMEPSDDNFSLTVIKPGESDVFGPVHEILFEIVYPFDPICFLFGFVFVLMF